MKVTRDTETQNFTREAPRLFLILYPDEIRDLYRTILNSGENTNFNQVLLEKLTEFLSDYDTGKYDKLTRCE